MCYTYNIAQIIKNTNKKTDFKKNQSLEDARYFSSIINYEISFNYKLKHYRHPATQFATSLNKFVLLKQLNIQHRATLAENVRTGEMFFNIYFFNCFKNGGT